MRVVRNLTRLVRSTIAAADIPVTLPVWDLWAVFLLGAIPGATLGSMLTIWALW